jgi:hypothetical protein
MDHLSGQQLHQPPKQALQIQEPLVQRQVRGSVAAAAAAAQMSHAGSKQRHQCPMRAAATPFCSCLYQPADWQMDTTHAPV